MLSTIFQLYQDDGRVLMNSVCNGNLFMVEKISATSGTRIRNRSLTGQRFRPTLQATGTLQGSVELKILN